ncbi:hypothetical protein H4582DRAFT_1958854, partial [Lactarius indigo]
PHRPQFICTGSRIVVDHQRINGTSSVFSAAVPALLSTSASEGINTLQNTPSILSELQENVHAIRITSPGRGHHDPLTRCLADHPTSTVTWILPHPPHLCLRIRRILRPLGRARHRHSKSRVRSVWCRITWTKCLRRACEPHALAGCAGRSWLKRGRVERYRIFIQTVMHGSLAPPPPNRKNSIRTV